MPFWAGGYGKKEIFKTVGVGGKEGFLTNNVKNY
jgi:hypothetical protein